MSNNAPRKKKANAKGATKKQSLLRSLPSVSNLLEHEEVRSWLESLPRALVVTSVQAAVDATRQAILSGEQTEPIEIEELVELAEKFSRACSSTLRSRGVEVLGQVDRDDCRGIHRPHVDFQAEVSHIEKPPRSPLPIH